MGLVKQPTIEIIQALDEAALDSALSRDLPADYLSHFSYAPLDAETLFTGFDEEMAVIDQAIQRWERHLTASFIVHGQRGAGKTTLLNMAQQQLFEQDQVVVRHTVENKIKTADELVGYLADIFPACQHQKPRPTGRSPARRASPGRIARRLPQSLHPPYWRLGGHPPSILAGCPHQPPPPLGPVHGQVRL